jgi:hypothetical protein
MRWPLLKRAVAASATTPRTVEPAGPASRAVRDEASEV